MLEKVVDIETADGKMNGYVYCPDEGGPFPVVLMYMDSAGVREPLADVCRRLASSGYYVLMPNLYYRRVRHVDIDVDRFNDPAYGEQTALMWSLNKHLTNSMVMDDTRAMFRFLEGEQAARQGKLGVLGYCMSGPFVYRAAGVFPERVAAAISMYGSPLVSDAPDSSHLTTASIRGEMYFGFAENEFYFSTSDVSGKLKGFFAEAGVPARFEIYRAVEHGFVLPGRRVYHKASSERQWVRVNDIFRRNLQESRVS